MLHTSLLLLGERSCKPEQESLARNVPYTAKLLLPAGQREKGQAAKPAAFQGYLCPFSKQRAAPGQLLL